MKLSNIFEKEVCKKCGSYDNKYSPCSGNRYPYYCSEYSIWLEKRCKKYIKALTHFTNINNYTYGMEINGKNLKWATMVKQNIKIAREVLK